MNKIIVTEKVVHDIKEIQRNKRLNIDTDPAKIFLPFQFHIRDVKTLTQTQAEEDEETLFFTAVQFYDGEVNLVTMPFEELSGLYEQFNNERDYALEKLMVKEDVS